MKILIIGGSKFIGKEIALKASESGHSVTLFNRGMTNPDLPYPTIKGDIENLREFKDRLRSDNYNIVVHCIAYTEKHAEDIRFVFKDSNTKIIALSSCDCYEVFQGLNRRIDKAELPVTETSPLSKMKYYWSGLSNERLTY